MLFFGYWDFKFCVRLFRRFHRNEAFHVLFLLGFYELSFAVPGYFS